jgi:hypothetical protein
MSYAIIGFGEIGHALAKAFARSASLLHCMILASVNASSGTAKLAPIENPIGQLLAEGLRTSPCPLRPLPIGNFSRAVQWRLCRRIHLESKDRKC